MILKRNTRPHVSLSSVKTITNLTCEQIENIKESLTYTNPEYVNAKRFSGYKNIRIPEYLMYYRKIPHGIVVPVGYDCNKLCETYYDFRTYALCDSVPPFVLTLREDQREAAEAYLRENTKPCTVKGLIQLPTGKGKTIVGLYLAAKLKQRTLVIVHKSDLVRGWTKDAKLAFDNKVSVGIYGGGKKKLGDFITVATVQTLMRLTSEELSELVNYFGFVIVDEVHHIAASSYDLINELSARYKLGLTATPERKDGLSNLMTDYLGGFCYQYKQKTEDEEKDILPVDVIIKSPSVYFDPVCKVFKRPSGAVDYRIDNLYAPLTYVLLDDEIRLSEIPYAKRPKILFSDVENFVVLDNTYIDMAVKDMKREISEGRSCIAFFRRKEHCSLYYHRLVRAGVPENVVQIYNGDCSAKQLEECMQKAESKEALMTLTTYSKSTEGTDVRAWEVEFLIGSVNDGKSAEQAVGRIRRVKSGKLKRARLYDYDLSSVPMFSKHIKTRVQRYQKLGFRFVENSRKSRDLFTRGYNCP